MLIKTHKETDYLFHSEIYVPGKSLGWSAGVGSSLNTLPAAQQRRDECTDEVRNGSEHYMIRH